MCLDCLIFLVTLNTSLSLGMDDCLEIFEFKMDCLDGDFTSDFISGFGIGSSSGVVLVCSIGVTLGCSFGPSLGSSLGSEG